MYNFFTSFHKLISNGVPVQISSHFDSMFSNIFMLDVFIFTDIEMPITGRGKAFCVLEYARLQSNKIVQHALVREL